MKKFLVVLLACVMVFAFASTALAADTQLHFPDVADQSDVAQTAIYRLASLDVLAGYAEDGTFRPNGNITRAEFAKICDYLADKVGAVPTFAAMNSAFTDVKIGSWYNGYVIAAYEYNLVNGYTNGTFGPQKNITMAEAITMLLRVVGYTNELAGDWPYDYIAAAKDLDLLDDVNFVSSKIATRAEIAIMANAILDLTVVQYDPDSVSIIDSSNATKNQLSTKYLGYPALYTTVANATDFIALGYDVLKGSFDAYTVSDAIFEESFNGCYSESNGWGFENFDKYGKDELQLWFFDGEYDVPSEDDHEDMLGLDVAAKYYIQGANLYNVAGQMADLTINDDDEVLFADVTSSLVYADAVEVDGDEITADDTDYDYENYDGLEDYDNTDNEDIVYGKLYLNADGDCYFYKEYSVFEDDEFGIVEEVTKDYVLFHDLHHGREMDRIPVNEKLSAYNDYIIIRDGEEIEAADLKDGDTVYATCDIYDTKDKGRTVDLFIAYSPKEGQLTERTKKVMTIDDEDYRYWNAFLSRDNGESFDRYDFWNLEKDAFDVDATYAVSYGYCAIDYFSADLEAYAYGVVTDIDTDDDKITILNREGEEVTYEYDDDDFDFDSAFNNNEDEFELGDLVNLIIKDEKVIDWEEVTDFDPERPAERAEVTSKGMLQVETSFNNNIHDQRMKIASDADIFVVVPDFTVADTREETVTVNVGFTPTGDESATATFDGTLPSGTIVYDDSAIEETSRMNGLADAITAATDLHNGDSVGGINLGTITVTYATIGSTQYTIYTVTSVVTVNQGHNLQNTDIVFDDAKLYTLDELKDMAPFMSFEIMASETNSALEIEVLYLVSAYSLNGDFNIITKAYQNADGYKLDLFENKTVPVELEGAYNNWWDVPVFAATWFDSAADLSRVLFIADADGPAPQFDSPSRYLQYVTMGDGYWVSNSDLFVPGDSYTDLVWADLPGQPKQYVVTEDTIVYDMEENEEITDFDPRNYDDDDTDFLWVADDDNEGTLLYVLIWANGYDQMQP